jgi:hypothetical protein
MLAPAPKKKPGQKGRPGQQATAVKRREEISDADQSLRLESKPVYPDCYAPRRFGLRGLKVGPPASDSYARHALRFGRTLSGGGVA